MLINPYTVETENVSHPCSLTKLFTVGRKIWIILKVDKGHFQKMILMLNKFSRVRFKKSNMTLS